MKLHTKGEVAMKHIKPGRGPSMLSGILGIFMIGFGVLWTILAATASPVFALFGVLWTAMAVTVTVYHWKNATKKNRYSAYDITDSDEEPDPLQQKFDGEAAEQSRQTNYEGAFCPYCGAKAQKDHRFCSSCGKKLSD